MTWNVANILMVFGASQGILLSFIVLLKNKNKLAGFSLAIMVFGISMNILYYGIVDTGICKTHLFIAYLYLPWAMLAAVGFYLYVVFSTKNQDTLTLKNKLAFLPFVVFSIFHITIGVCQYNYECQLIPYKISFIFYEIDEYSGIVISFLSGFLSLRLLPKIEASLQQRFSNYNKRQLIFHKQFSILVMVFAVYWFLSYTYSEFFDGNIKVYYGLALISGVSLYWITYAGFIRKETIIPEFIPNENDLIKSKTLSYSKEDPLFLSLIKLFEKEKPYTDPELSLDKLASMINTNKSYLSSMINQVTNKNFYHFINEYRVKHLIQLFNEEKTSDFTIISLAYESGFNSKSTFQAVFKKETGKTPSQFIDSIK